MKKFIRQCVIFSLLFVPVLIAYSLIKTNLHQPYIFDKTIKTIMTGDSHVQCAINSDLVDGLENISVDSEGYIHSYFKLKKILAANPQIENIILGFSYHNLSSFFDAYTIGKHAKSILPRYVDLFSYNELFELVKAYPALWWPAFSKIVSTNNDKYPYIGKFSNGHTKELMFKKDLMLKRINSQYFMNGKPREVSKNNIEYFGRLITLCKQHKVKLTLINTPLHKKYFDEIPIKYIEEYKKLIKESDLDIIEFESLVLSDQNFLPDGDHLNTSGAFLATHYFIKKWAAKN
jgi:hypothetical protein